jgi:hypothetical protein
MRLAHWAAVVAALTTCAFVHFIPRAMKEVMFMSGRSQLPPRVGALQGTLASAHDKFWSHENWPGVKFNLPLQGYPP